MDLKNYTLNLNLHRFLSCKFVFVPKWNSHETVYMEEDMRKIFWKFNILTVSNPKNWNNKISLSIYICMQNIYDMYDLIDI